MGTEAKTMMMEWELARHEWPDPADEARSSDALPLAIRALARADGERSAEHAVARLRATMSRHGSQVQPPQMVTPCLVSLLWTSAAPAVDEAIHLLADLGTGEFNPSSSEDVLKACRDELVLGFDAFAGCLASRTGRLVLLSCVRLVALCGRHDERLRARARYLLTKTADRAVLLGDRDDILAEAATLA